MLVATAYRVGEQFDASVLPAIMPSNPSPVKRMGINLFHCIYGHHAHEQLLRHTAKKLDITLEGNACMHRVLDGKGYRKGIPHQTKLGRGFVDLGGKKDIASAGGGVLICCLP